MTRTTHVASGYILDGMTAQPKVTFLNGLTRGYDEAIKEAYKAFVPLRILKFAQ
jgi:hypothetical protein